MASPITWRNVGRGNNGAAVGLLNSATSDFNNAFKGINAAVGDIEQGRENEYKHLVKTNTDEFLNRINSFNNVDDFTAAQQSGEFQNMLAGYNGDVNQELTRGAAAAHLRKLQNRRTDEIAYTTANANEDERLAVAAEKPFITELNNLFEVDPDKARALAQQYGESGKIRDYSGLMEAWETESRSDTDYANQQSDRARQLEIQRQNDAAMQNVKDLFAKGQADQERYLSQVNSAADGFGIPVINGQARPDLVSTDKAREFERAIQSIEAPMSATMLQQEALRAQGSLVNPETAAYANEYLATMLNPQLAVKDRDTLEKREAALRKSYNIDQNVFRPEMQNFDAATEAARIVKENGEKFGGWWDSDRATAQSEMMKALSGNYALTLKDEGGESINIRVTPAIVELALSNAEDWIFTDFEPDKFTENLEKAIKDLGLTKQYKDFKEYEEESLKNTRAAQAKFRQGDSAYRADMVQNSLSGLSGRISAREESARAAQQQVVQERLAREAALAEAQTRKEEEAKGRMTDSDKEAFLAERRAAQKQLEIQMAQAEERSRKRNAPSEAKEKYSDALDEIKANSTNPYRVRKLREKLARQLEKEGLTLKDVGIRD
jgi:hypothetical protein